MPIATKVADRIASGLKRFQPILIAAKSRDVNESDTSMIVTDMMAELLGYDKYTELTKELTIKGTYCDLATRIEGKIQMIIEIKAIGVELKESHFKQAVDYAANQGIEWVALTNGHIWKVFKVTFTQPINAELVLELDMFSLNPKDKNHVESIYLLTRESMLKSGLYAYYDQSQATNKFDLAAVVLSEPVLDSVRREIRRLYPDVRIQIDDLRTAIIEEVLKREVIEGEKAEAARKKVQKSMGKLLKTRKKKGESPSLVPEADLSEEHKAKHDTSMPG